MTARAPLILDLLPRFYGRRDEAGTLRALTAVLDEPHAGLSEQLRGIYRDLFIDTCGEEALPRLGALVGVAALPEYCADPRALIAEAAGLARAKGTWGAAERALALYGGWPVRLAPGGETGWTLDVFQQPTDTLFNAAPSPASDGGPACFRFDPLGYDCPLWAPASASAPHRPLGDTASAAQLVEHVGIACRGASGGWRCLAAEEIAIADLSGWGGGARTPDTRALIDPGLGRFQLLDIAAEAVAVRFTYAVAGRMGGGGYARWSPPRHPDAWIAEVSAYAEAGREEGRIFRSIADALDAWRDVPGEAVIRITDSAAHDLRGLSVGTAMRVCPSDPDRPRRLTLEALDGEAPTLRGKLCLSDLGQGLDVSLRGLWIEGGADIGPGVAACFEHCTLGRPGPGAAAVLVSGEPSRPGTARLRHCVSAGVSVGAGGVMDVADSIVDAGAETAITGGGCVTLVRSTILGPVSIAGFDAGDSLIAGTILALEGQADRCAFNGESGPVETTRRFVFDGAVPHRGFRQSGYARLPHLAEEALRTGASNGSELGACNEERCYAREQLLPQAIRDWVPAGIQVVPSFG